MSLLFSQVSRKETKNNFCGVWFSLWLRVTFSRSDPKQRRRSGTTTNSSEFFVVLGGSSVKQKGHANGVSLHIVKEKTETKKY
jgi:hypothetical protein